MDKIINFTNIKKYFCTECKGFHKKRTPNQIKKMRIAFTVKYPNKEIKLPISKFDLHQEFAYKLTDSELWKRQFKESWNRYDLKEVLKKAKQ